MSVTLFLIRHGETDQNVKGLIQGWMDTALNETGHAQAKQAVDAFNDRVDVIYSSDLRRATETAEYFRQKYPNTPYFEDTRLRERNFGDATGLHRDGFDWDGFWASNEVASAHGAETLEIYNQRVKSFLATLKDTDFKNVLIVTHSGTINRMRELLTNQTFQPHPNGSVLKMRLDQDTDGVTGTIL